MTHAAALTAPFDAVADTYDAEFSNMLLGQLLRRRVWHHLDSVFPTGARVLELGCGTGEDALWLARRGVSVLATDVSEGMLRTTTGKVAAAGLARSVRVARLDANQPADLAAETFDGAFANFGVLNCVRDLASLGQYLHTRIRPGGRLVTIVMGPFCAWEAAFYLLRGDLVRAKRRAVAGGLAQVGPAQLPIWYPSPRTLARAFSPAFSVHIRATGIGTLLPPSYLARLVERFPRLFQRLANVEASMPLSAWWADHYLMAFERR